MRMLANRLKSVLSSLIFDSQSAFIPGRLISDNVIIAFEIQHFLNQHSRGNKGFDALKIEMSKGYDPM